MPAEMNPEDLARDVGNDLFGDPPEGGDEVVLKGEPVEPTPAPAPEPISMPRAWKKEHETLWTGLQRPVQEYLTQREADVEKGFVQYAKGHKSWAELTSPFEGVLQQYPQVNPVQLMQGLMRNHLQMVQGSPEQRKALALQLLKGYGVDLNAPAAPAPSPEFQAVSNELRSLQSSFQAFQKTQQDQALAEQTKIVEAFATDPQNKYFSEVQEDIIRFIQTGVADSIQSAYELAIWANPAVRAKLLAEQAPQGGKTSPAKPPIEGSGEGTPRNRKPETIDDTIASVIAKHYAH